MAAPETLDSEERSLLVRQSERLVPELRRYLDQHTRALAAHIELASAEQHLDVGRSYSAIYDSLLSALFDASRALTGTWRPMCLGAVGSYGRQVLSPKSDLDVRLLCWDDPDGATPLAEALLYPLWDAGLDIGHQVVTPRDLVELATTDLTTATALLDFRTIAGDGTLAEKLSEQAFKRVFCRERLGNFADRLEAYNRTRHERYGGADYVLEPHLKNGPGGLRDLDIAHWCARAAYQVRGLEELPGRGVLLEREWAELNEARAELIRVRNALHLSVGRKTDRLTFDQQEKLAERLGYGTHPSAVERLMRTYHRSTRVIRRSCEDLVSRLRPPPRSRRVQRSLGPDLAVVEGQVVLLDEGALMREPWLGLQLYQEAVDRGLLVGKATRRAVVRATSSPTFCAALRTSTAAKRSLQKLVCVVRPTRFPNGSLLRELHEVGLLVAMIPEFGELVGRVQHDRYHVLPTDEHCIAAVDHLRSTIHGLSKEHGLLVRLVAELPRRHVLFFATLLHDIGKAQGTRGHAERGAKMAGAIVQALGFSESDVLQVKRLVRLHLRMYHVATRRDTEDPVTLERFCRDVGTQESLRELYLMTVADIETTSDSATTAWKRGMLDALYLHADRRFERGAQGDRHSRADQARASLLSSWRDDATLPFARAFSQGLSDRYLLSNPPEAVVQHARFALASATAPCSVRLGNTRSPYTEVWVSADDRPGLLALIASGFRQARFRVLSAEIHSWTDPEGKARALDLFWVRRGLDDTISERHANELRNALERMLQHENPLDALPDGASSRPATPEVETRVAIDNHSAEHHTVVEVITLDRPELLLRLAAALQHMNLGISFAKINTEGDRVADVFYVSDEHGQKVTSPERLEAIELRLRQAASPESLSKVLAQPKQTNAATAAA